MKRGLRLISLGCGVLLIAFSVFLLSRLEVFHYFYGGSGGGRGTNYFYFYAYRLVVLILIGAVFILGIALIVASYYRHDELHLVDKI